MLGHAAFIRRKILKVNVQIFQIRVISEEKRVMIINVTHLKMNRFPDLKFKYVEF